MAHRRTSMDGKKLSGGQGVAGSNPVSPTAGNRSSEAGRPKRSTRLWHTYSNRYSNAVGVQQPSPPQRLVEPVCRLAAQAGTDVAVDVRGDRVRRVAQVSLDDLGVRASSEQEAG